ncbi:hypothetical protein BS50DRAFT_580002 [Corynespora cassiicola Philippines]|uniref:DUF7580 domain-containing protein n=1 Tax=Corynespora cassiicola Philippines TaxID=1448308 RepID=A0A2T2N1U7_CORCC|nr:hypothetical protein BS50DRAFT_580002 [Corynespora cassiicola Philippines]
MSGLEVTGVVLGALPLIISALEHYAEGVATAKRYWRYKNEIKGLLLRIVTERGIFMNTLELLLTGIVRVEHMEEFLASPGGKAWSEAAIQQQLENRLRNVYKAYLDNVKEMEESLRVMMKKLGLDADGKPQFSDPNAFKQEYKRLKFSITKSEYEDQLSRLSKFNQDLIRMTKQSLELEPTRMDKKAKAVCPDFNAFRSYARSLYDTLRGGLQCSCQGHTANLRLEHRSQNLKSVPPEKTPFRVIFSYSAGSDSQRVSWTEADICCVIDGSGKTATALTQNSVSTEPKAKRKVRFGQANSQEQSASAILATASAVQSAVADPTADRIHDLCKALQSLNQPYRDMCIGYLFDKLKRKHGIYPLPPPVSAAHQHQWVAYSLRDVLSHDTKVGRKLSQHDKLKVAIDVSSSVLQLYNTPWLNEEWSKDDVLFIQRPGFPPSSLYEHPFVRRILGSSPSKTYSKPSGSTYSIIRNRTLFTLGILLIELWYGKSIEELQIPEDLNYQNIAGVAWGTAYRLVEDELEFEAGPRYSLAVRRCIRGDFDRRDKDMSLEDEDFQKVVYNGVVALLEKTFQQFNSLD